MFHFDEHMTARIRALGSRTLPLWILLASHGMWVFALISFGFLLTGVLPWDDVGIPIVLTHVVTLGVQQIVRRDRPPESVAKIVMWRRTPSFPSAHSSGSMAFALVLAMGFQAFGTVGMLCGILMITLAVLIGISRIMVGVHYMTDVLCGWIFGLVITTVFLLVV